MEAPNKLFIRPEKIKVEMIPGGELPNVGIQYIRKELLLEWAKKELEMRRNTGDDYFYPAIVVLGDLIDKLNSL